MTVQVIRPKRLGKNIIPNLVQRRQTRELRGFEQRVRRDLAMTVRTWKRKPRFLARREVRGNSTAVVFYASDKRWNWISRGTKPHTITPKRAKRLRFPTHFRPATNAGTLRGNTARSGPPIFYRNSVRHPGVTPREWHKIIARRNNPDFKQRMRRTLRRLI